MLFGHNLSEQSGMFGLEWQIMCTPPGIYQEWIGRLEFPGLSDPGVVSGWQWGPEESRIDGEAPGCLTAKQRDAGEETTGERSPRPTQPPVRERNMRKHTVLIESSHPMHSYNILLP